jgi:glycosyltransferase involved in cell wall biosynthesis
MTRLLVIGSVWPEPQSSAAGAHILQVLRPLIRQGWEVTYASTATESEHAADLPSLGISTLSANVNDSSFDDLIRSLQPDVVIFDRFFIEEQFGWRVEEHCPNALRILNAEDLHFLRNAREQAHRRGEALRMAHLQNEIARREVAAILRSDLSLIISSYEMKLLENTFNVDAEQLHYCPFMIDIPERSVMDDMPGFEDRCDFFSVGNFRHAPNWDGVQWLATEVWPLIRKRMPGAKLHIAGSYASNKQMALHDPDQGFFMDGRIEDADARFRGSRVCLAPLRFGAGLKGKLIDAMRNGTPSVTTQVGAEAMAIDLPWGGAVEEDAPAIAAAAVRLHESKADWKRAQTNGFEILANVFGRRQHEVALVDQIASARRDLGQRREHNFMGSILRDHHHRSTRYLALWIEAKNKLPS